MILASFLDIFGIISDSIGDRFRIVLAPSRDHSGIILGVRLAITLRLSPASLGATLGPFQGHFGLFKF